MLLPTLPLPLPARSLRRACLVLATLGFLPVAAQDSGLDPAVPAPRLELMPQSNPAGAEPSLMPEVPAPAPARPEPAPEERPRREKKREEKPSKTETAGAELEERVRLRIVRTRAGADPGVQGEWEAARTAHTENEKRAALARYYERLYGRMEKLDPKLKKPIAEQRTLALRRLEQPRIDPSPLLSRSGGR